MRHRRQNFGPEVSRGEQLSPRRVSRGIVSSMNWLLAGMDGARRINRRLKNPWWLPPAHHGSPPSAGGVPQYAGRVGHSRSGDPGDAPIVSHHDNRREGGGRACTCEAATNCRALVGC
jgi:hypothetical protein